jgi:hypothetical protein
MPKKNTYALTLRHYRMYSTLCLWQTYAYGHGDGLLKGSTYAYDPNKKS